MPDLAAGAADVGSPGADEAAVSDKAIISAEDEYVTCTNDGDVGGDPASDATKDEDFGDESYDAHGIGLMAAFSNNLVFCRGLFFGEVELLCTY